MKKRIIQFLTTYFLFVLLFVLQKPVFMVYDLPQLIAGLGGVEQTADALKWFKKEVKKAGFPGLELQFAMWSINLNYSGFDGSKTENPANDFIRTLGFETDLQEQTDGNR